MARLLDSFNLSRPVPVRPRYTYALVTAESMERTQPRLYRDCRGLASGPWDQLTLRLLADLNRNAVDQYKGFATHSGVVAVEGRAIALPADSKGGKSTLTAACVMAGFDYVSDESLCLNFETGAVERYVKPIMLSAESCRLLGIAEPFAPNGGDERPVTPDELGGHEVSGTPKLAEVVFAEYGHDSASLAPLPPSEIVAGLLRLSFNHYKHPADSFRIITALANTARAWRLTYDDPAEAAALLRREFAT